MINCEDYVKERETKFRFCRVPLDFQTPHLKHLPRTKKWFFFQWSQPQKISRQYVRAGKFVHQEGLIKYKNGCFSKVSEGYVHTRKANIRRNNPKARTASSRPLKVATDCCNNNVRRLYLIIFTLFYPGTSSGSTFLLQPK